MLWKILQYSATIRDGCDDDSDRAAVAKRPSPSSRIVAGPVHPMKPEKESSIHCGGYKLDINVSAL